MIPPAAPLQIEAPASIWYCGQKTPLFQVKSCIGEEAESAGRERKRFQRETQGFPWPPRRGRGDRCGRSPSDSLPSFSSRRKKVASRCERNLPRQKPPRQGKDRGMRTGPAAARIPSSVSFADSCLAAARSRHGSDLPPAGHSLPRRRFATQGKPEVYPAGDCLPLGEGGPASTAGSAGREFLARPAGIRRLPQAGWRMRDDAQFHPLCARPRLMRCSTSP